MNKRQRLLSAAAAATLGLAGLIGAAAPAAHAATITVTDADCTSSPVTTGTAISASPGDVLDFTAVLTSCKDATVPVALVTASSDISAAAGATNATVTPSGPSYAVGVGGADFTAFAITVGSSNGTFTVAFSNGGTFGSTLRSTEWQVSVTGGGSGGGGSSADSSSAPAPVTQQFGMPATDTCDEAQPEGLNWSGVTSGGWGLSWAQWMNNGNGGAVCTRTLVYSAAQSKWVVN